MGRNLLLIHELGIEIGLNLALSNDRNAMKRWLLTAIGTSSVVAMFGLAMLIFGSGGRNAGDARSRTEPTALMDGFVSRQRATDVEKMLRCVEVIESFASTGIARTMSLYNK